MEILILLGFTVFGILVCYSVFYCNQLDWVKKRYNVGFHQAFLEGLALMPFWWMIGDVWKKLMKKKS